MTIAIQQFVVVDAASVNESQVLGRIALFDADGNPVEVGGGDTIAEARLVPTGGTSGQVLKVGADGPEWGADTNTTYAALTAAAAQAGTATGASTISAKVLADEIDRRVAAALAAA